MKTSRRIALLLFVCFFHIIAIAQIQTTFLGLKMGVTSMEESVEILNKSGLKPKVSEGKCNVYDIEFAGRMWSGASFSYYNNRLSEVRFVYLRKTSLHHFYGWLLESLMSKYKRYYFPELSDTETGDFFCDGKTAITLTYIPDKEYDSVILLYMDCSDLKDELKPYENQL